MKVKVNFQAKSSWFEIRVFFLLGQLPYEGFKAQSTLQINHKMNPGRVIAYVLDSVMLRALECGIVVNEFEVELPYYAHFRTNALVTGMNPFYPQAMG